jgi:hypothetical protein
MGTTISIAFSDGKMETTMRALRIRGIAGEVRCQESYFEVA